MKLPSPAAILAALRDPKRWKRWALEALILVAIVGAITTWQNSGLAAGVAPPLAGLRTDGSHVILGAGNTAAGSQATTLVVFWASWCSVCKAEAGNIESIAKDWPVISVAMQSGDRKEIAEYLAERRLKVPALADDDSDIADVWRVRVVPAHFVIDAAGNIRFRVVGYATSWGLRARLWWADKFPL
ncbi:MAG: redoxin domain-containing protein [Rhodocyclaceae bacterium]|nr:redoxin domain-containing protein [Rhodocyclaceae bacterium]